MDVIEKLVAEALGGDAAATGAVLGKARADGVSDLASAALVREDEWVAWGVPRIRARALVGTLADRSRTASAPSPAGTALLPQVPDDVSLLEAFRVGGVAKVEPTDVVAAVRVAFADRLGVLKAEERLLDAIEERARALDEPCPPIFYDLQRSRSRKAHAEVLGALGVPGTFVTDRRKRELLARIGKLWDALSGFQQRIDDWVATWQSRVTNPGALLAGIASLVGGGTDPVPARGLMEAPDTGPVADAARAVVDVANRVFAGPGIPVARALAADAVELRALLERPELVDALGAASREELLKKIGLGVSSDLVRAERAVTQFVLALMRIPDLEPAQLPMLLVALKELGATVPWAMLAETPGTPPPRSFGA